MQPIKKCLKPKLKTTQLKQTCAGLCVVTRVEKTKEKYGSTIINVNYNETIALLFTE